MQITSWRNFWKQLQTFQQRVSFNAFYGWTKYKLVGTENSKNIQSHKEVPQFFEMGSSGLHVIQSGVKTTGWEIEKNFKGMWRFFDDSPARRDRHITINQSDQFPVMFY